MNIRKIKIIDNFFKWIEKIQRQRRINRIKKNIKRALAIIIPIILILSFHFLKKKAKKTLIEKFKAFISKKD